MEQIFLEQFVQKTLSEIQEALYKFNYEYKRLDARLSSDVEFEVKVLSEGNRFTVIADSETDPSKIQTLKFLLCGAPGPHRYRL